MEHCLCWCRWTDSIFNPKIVAPKVHQQQFLSLFSQLTFVPSTKLNAMTSILCVLFTILFVHVTSQDLVRVHASIVTFTTDFTFQTPIPGFNSYSYIFTLTLNPTRRYTLFHHLRHLNCGPSPIRIKIPYPIHIYRQMTYHHPLIGIMSMDNPISHT